MPIVTLAEATQRLKAGDVVAIPTETVYGLAADAANPKAVAKIFAAKGRPDFNPLISHIPDAGWLARYALLDARAEKLARAFWPGALTLVLPRIESCPIAPAVSAGLPSIALRVPAHPVAQAVLREAGLALAAPSANRSGHVSPTRPEHVLESLGAEIPVLDGGPCEVGLESTVIGLTGPQATLLRPGGLAREAIEAVLGEKLVLPKDARIESPGMLLKHYAPRLPVRLEATKPEGREGLLCFGPRPPGFAAYEDLSPGGDLAEAAARLYDGLHRLDRADISGIAVSPIPESGLGLAINDRLRRAARGR